MKICFLIILCFHVTCAVYPQNETGWFPKEPLTIAIDKYISNITADDQNTIRNEYRYILAFIEDNIAAIQENIEKSFKGIDLTVKKPAFIEGQLKIVEEKAEIDYMWDSELKTHRAVPRKDYVTELVEIIVYMRIYNHLLDFWYLKTGERLFEEIDVKAKFNDIQKSVEMYQNEESFLF